MISEVYRPDTAFVSNIQAYNPFEHTIVPILFLSRN